MQTVITIWLTMSFCYCAKEWQSPYAGTVWIFDVFFAPYFIISDIYDEYVFWRKKCSCEKGECCNRCKK
jgi:hypothetical protein